MLAPRLVRTALAALLAIAALLALPAVGAAQTLTFNAIGFANWQVPANVTSASVEVVGGSGGHDGAPGSSCTPGLGGDVTGTLKLPPGEVIEVDVGGNGGDAAGHTGGLSGHGVGGYGGTVLASATAAGGGGGGGLTALSGVSSGLTVYAGGGGGCGGFASSSGGNGGNGGASSLDGANGTGGFSGAAGAGRSGANGGAGGANAPADSSHGAAANGPLGGNGSGSNAFLAGGGGGGGGHDGGGGGGAAASNEGSGGGGGGGTSFIDNPETGTDWRFAPASHLGNGWVTITYTPRPAPAVSTGSASNITETSAILVGTVNAGGLDTTYHFDYRTADGYSLRTADAKGSPNGAVVPVTATLSALQPGTLYHYRLVATNATGTTEGADQTFQTPGPPGVNTGPGTGAPTDPATGSAPGTLPAGPGASQNATLSLLGKPGVRRHSVSFKVACKLAACHLNATLIAQPRKRAGQLVGAASTVIPAGASRTITISLNATGRRLQARFARLPAKLGLSLLAGNGQARVTRTLQITFP
jgi:hypothetical protein